jgi:aldose 1-epimerase
MTKFYAITILFLIMVGLVSCKQNHDKEAFHKVLKANNFKKTIDGKQVGLYFLKNGTMEAAITNYGGRIVSLMVPDNKGVMGDVVLGFKSIDDYLNANAPFHGATIGRVCNRIANGKFELNGVEHSLQLNGGLHHLHGGSKGFFNQVWDVKEVSDTSLTLSYLSVDGEMGYPGNLTVEVTFSLSPTNDLSISYKARTDQSTPVNLTNHAFFNLAGEGNGSTNEHLLTINADTYTSVDSIKIPEFNSPVNGTPFDFRTAKPIGKDLSQQDSNIQLNIGSGYDHNFVLNKESQNTMTLAATVVEPQSGRKMEILTKEPCLQFFTANFFNGSDIGKYGLPLKYRESFALETQHYPDSPNNKNAPSIILNPGETFETKTMYRFSVVKY